MMPTPTTLSPTATLLRAACIAVARQLGPGHSEAVYQKATSLMLQAHNRTHHCEYHVPVPFRPHVLGGVDTLSASRAVAPPAHALDTTAETAGVTTSTAFHVGSERIDILLYDDDCKAHVVELKAVGGSLSPKRDPVPPDQTMPAAHTQLLKYVRLLRQDPRTQDALVAGYVVNFRQSVTFGAPEAMPVEFDVFDCASKQWTFGQGDTINDNETSASEEEESPSPPPSPLLPAMPLRVPMVTATLPSPLSVCAL